MSANRKRDRYVELGIRRDGSVRFLRIGEVQDRYVVDLHQGRNHLLEDDRHGVRGIGRFLVGIVPDGHGHDLRLVHRAYADFGDQLSVRHLQFGVIFGDFLHDARGSDDFFVSFDESDRGVNGADVDARKERAAVLELIHDQLGGCRVLRRNEVIGIHADSQTTCGNHQRLSTTFL